jgi:hypothetical protein
LTVGAESRAPVWSADGTWIYFESMLEGARAIFRRRADGGGTQEHVVALGALGAPEAAHPGGSVVLFSDCESGGRCTLGAWSAGDTALRRFPDITSTIGLQAALSPDGRWLAYATNGDGARFTVFVEPFPPTGARFEVPHNVEAAHPLWTSASTLMYQDFSTLWEVDVAGTSSVTFGRPRPVQRGAISPGTSGTRRNLDLVPGTDTLVVVIPADGQAPVPTGSDRQVNVVLNWVSALGTGTGVVK